MSTDEKRHSLMPEIWGGIESSINRVGDWYRDQLHYSGHYDQPSDIDLFAGLGISALRYPILWEHHEPVENNEIDWRWATQQLDHLRKKNITPIAGLLHHGSGPSFTSLLDKDFPRKFSSYAGKVAKQFPWLQYYTPVNEPLTTARFSGLYGIWYPHKSQERSFIKMLLHQVKATILAMQEIRKINPGAKLVQTEDLSKTHSTPLLSYQASFENKRRWLTYDLLCGKIKPGHFFWNYFITAGIPGKELLFFVENSCPPDIMGFNYYVTSERYLDQNLEKYPVSTHGGNGRHLFADTEAVRTGHMQGIATLLKEAWLRYKLPIAVTECHLCCTREEQLRWLNETWHACCQLKKDGIDIRAVTPWALLGAYDWDSLLVQPNLSYETGVFDLRQNARRPTLLAKMIASLSRHGAFHHPLLKQRGWWHKEITATTTKSICQEGVLILGENNPLATVFAEIFKYRSIPYHIAVYDASVITSYIEKYQPWAIIDTSSFVNVNVAEICYNEELRYMAFTSFDEHYKNKMILSVNPSALLINLTQDRRLLDIAGEAMDLFIDEEKGIWEISTEGMLVKLEQHEAVESKITL